MATARQVTRKLMMSREIPKLISLEEAKRVLLSPHSLGSTGAYVAFVLRAARHHGYVNRGPKGLDNFHAAKTHLEHLIWGY